MSWPSAVGLMTVREDSSVQVSLQAAAIAGLPRSPMYPVGCGEKGEDVETKAGIIHRAG